MHVCVYACMHDCMCARVVHVYVLRACCALVRARMLWASVYALVRAGVLRARARRALMHAVRVARSCVCACCALVRVERSCVRACVHACCTLLLALVRACCVLCMRALCARVPACVGRLSSTRT